MKTLFKLASAVALVAAASTASALQIQVGADLIEVGSVDIFVTNDTVQPSNVANETVFVETNVADAISVNFAHKTEDNIVWHEVLGQTNVYAFELNNAANNYFLLKLGANPSHFLYKNVDSNSYAVIDFDQFANLKKNVDTDIVSHITEFDVEMPQDPTNPSEVPLPAAAWLFGSALLGLGFKKRK